MLRYGEPHRAELKRLSDEVSGLTAKIDLLQSTVTASSVRPPYQSAARRFQQRDSLVGSSPAGYAGGTALAQSWRRPMRVIDEWSHPGRSDAAGIMQHTPRHCVECIRGRCSIPIILNRGQRACRISFLRRCFARDRRRSALLLLSQPRGRHGGRHACMGWRAPKRRTAEARHG
jgi:hypothetical protein